MKLLIHVMYDAWVMELVEWLHKEIFEKAFVHNKSILDIVSRIFPSFPNGREYAVL